MSVCVCVWMRASVCVCVCVCVWIRACVRTYMICVSSGFCNYFFLFLKVLLESNNKVTR